MKKTLLALLLVLCMLVTFTAFTASAEETEAVPEETAETATHTHCECGGNAADNEHHECGEAVEYTPISEALAAVNLTTQTVDFGKLPSGNYYLDEDIFVLNDSSIGSTKQIKYDASGNVTTGTASYSEYEITGQKTIKLCLNGKNITTDSGERTFGSPKHSYLAICDCKGQLVNGQWEGGSISGGTSSYGCILYTHAGSTVQLYGGKYKTGHDFNAIYGGLFVSAMDCGVDLTGDNKYNSSDYKGSNLAAINVYNCQIVGGRAAQGGNFNLMHAAFVNVYGGVIEDGVAAYKTYDGKNYIARGGNVVVGGSCTLNVYDGVIRGGKAAQYSVEATSANGQGGNIYSTGKVNIYGGTVCNGFAEHNPVVKDDQSGYVTSTPGRGGNIFVTGTAGYLTISGGKIYGGVANGNAGGNIFFSGKTFNMTDGKIWGGVANADKDAVKSAHLKSASDVAGGSIALHQYDYTSNGANKTQYPTFNMSGGSIGIDDQGNPAGGTAYPLNSESGNLYGIYSGTKINLSGGVIAYGNTWLENGELVHGMIGKGGNIGGSASYTISGQMVIRDGYAAGYGGNWTLFNNGGSKMTGGTISGGYAEKNGGNIIVDGNNTTAHALTISGGTISGGESGVMGGNIAINHASKIVNVKGSAEISDGFADNYGGNFYINGTVSLSENAKVTGGEATNYGGSIYSTGEGSLTISGSAQVTGGKSKTSHGGSINSRGTVSITDTAIVSGGKALAGNGGNIYLWTTSTLTASGSAQITGGESKNAGGNIYAAGAVTLEGNAVVSDGKVNNSSSGNIYVKDGGTVTIKDSVTVSGGTAKIEGGNITVSDGGILNIYSGTISGGNSGTMGGNIHAASGSTLTITGGTITGGTAVQQGGNLCLAEDAEISGVTISGGIVTGIPGTPKTEDTAEVLPKGFGGNIYTSSGTTVTLTDCTISGGTSYYQGGSIFSRGLLTITGGTITDGSAIDDAESKVTTSGGNIYSEGSVDIDGTVISGGKATHGGNLTLAGGTNTINNATISNGAANLMCDGTTNGNGGNIYSVGATTTTTITGCAISGGVAQRAGSVGAWSKVTIENTTITGGHAAINGGNIMTYSNGQLTLKDGTVLRDGKADEKGAAIGFSSNKGKPQVIEDGVEIYSGTSSASGIYLSGGDLTIIGAPVIEQIYVSDDSKWTMDVNGLTTTTPIEIKAEKPGAFAESATDKLSCFVNLQGYVMDYRGGYLYLDAPTAVYVSDNGSDSNPGTQTAPYLTVDHALDMLANNGTVNIVDKVTMESWDRHEKAATLTGGELDLTSSVRLELGDSIHFKAMTITMSTGEYYIYCDGFKTVIDEDVTVRYFDGTNYTTTSSKSYIYGGGRASYAKEHGAFTGTDLTVLSGVWGFIYGGNNQDVDMTGDVHLTVGGNVNKGVDYATAGHSSSTNGYNLVFGGSRSADINGTVYMTITGNAIANSFHGGSNGETHVDNIELTVSGGEGMALYGAGRGGAQTVGQITVNYNGGTFEQVFGGALKQDLTGNVELYLNGGKITRRIYGGCYNDTSGLNFATEHQVTGDVTVYIGGVQITRELTQHSDRSIYGHSRCKATSTDAENSAIIFLNETAYNTYKDNLKYEDSEMGIFMYGVSAADNLHYYTYTASGDTLTRSCAYDSTESATAKIVLDPQVELIYRGEVIEPATVEYTNWTVLPVELVYSNNDRAGTASASITAGGQTATLSFALENGALAQIGNAEYYTVQAAVDALEKNQYVKLVGNSDENVTVSSDLYLDLNGHSITGTVTVNEGATLYGMDSTTDDYDCTDGNGNDNYGTVKVVGAVEPYFKTSVTGSIRRYLTCTEAEGVFSFHRMYLGITHMSLRPGVVGVGYKAMFCGDEKVVNMLNETEAFGYRLWIEGVGEAQQFKARNEFESRKVVTLRLQNFDVEQYGEENIYAEVYMKLSDGTVIDSADYCYTLRSLLESINNNSGSYSEAQLRAIKAMCAPFAQFMQNANWAVSNLIG